MDEQTLRQQVCQAAQQLWLRRLICGDGGVISAEVNRRRYVVTPAGYRRADLGLDDLLCVDLEGQNVAAGPMELPESYWAVHQLAYQVGADPQRPSQAEKSTREPIHATVLADPPNVLALAMLEPNAKQLTIANHADLSVVDPSDSTAVSQALGKASLLLLPGEGVFTAAASLPKCLNLIEQLEHHAAIELATSGS